MANQDVFPAVGKIKVKLENCGKLWKTVHTLNWVLYGFSCSQATWPLDVATFSLDTQNRKAQTRTHTHTLPSHTLSVVYSHTLWVKLKTRFVYFSIINYDFVIRFDSLLLQKYLCHQHHPSRWRTPPSSPGRVSIVSDKHELIGRGTRDDGIRDKGARSTESDARFCA